MTASLTLNDLQRGKDTFMPKSGFSISLQIDEGLGCITVYDESSQVVFDVSEDEPGSWTWINTTENSMSFVNLEHDMGELLFLAMRIADAKAKGIEPMEFIKGSSNQVEEA